MVSAQPLLAHGETQGMGTLPSFWFEHLSVISKGDISYLQPDAVSQAFWGPYKNTLSAISVLFCK